MAHSLTDIAREIYLDIAESPWVRRGGITGPKYSFRAFESAVRASELYSTSTTIREKWRTFVAKGIFAPVEEGLYGQVIVDAAAWNRGLPRAPALKDPAEDHTQTHTNTHKRRDRRGGRMTSEEICMEQVVHALLRLLNTLDDARRNSTYGAIQERVIRAGGPSDVPGASKLADLATVDLQDVHNDICKVWKKVYRMQNTAEKLEELARLREAVRHE